MLTGEATVPYAHKRPNLPPQPTGAIPHSGNFTHRDEFDSETLAPNWAMLRTPRESWHDLTSTPGSLTLRARPEELSGVGQPSALFRRQQHGTATASAAMVYRPEKPGDRAGIVAFHNASHYYFLGVTQLDGRPTIRLWMRAGGATLAADSVMASAPIEIPRDGRVFLKVQARDGRYDFSYATRENEWQDLARDADGTILSTRVAGGFVGTMFGMYAQSIAQ